MMQNYNFHPQTVSVAGPKRIPHKIQNGATTKNTKVARKDFQHLTLSKWQSSRNTGEGQKIRATITTAAGVARLGFEF
jgi:hypothetical protein